tara:strand:- start:614 stop:1738 length:1125 start_codon:yes stop_codon:yes gene_type:complete
LKKNISVFIGTRPEAIKLAPLILSLKSKTDFEVNICLTGQHNDMVYDILNYFNIKPDQDFFLMTKNQTLEKFSSKLLIELSSYFRSKVVDLVVVQGDTVTTMICALGAYYNKVPIAYIEAGLRTNDIYSPWPEEGHRKMISVIASILFAPLLDDKNVLLSENINASKIHITGNTAIDSLLKVKKSVAVDESNYYCKYPYLKNHPFILITVHRRENFGSKLRTICNSIDMLAKKFNDHIFLFPVHFNPSVRREVLKILDSKSKNNVILIDPVKYDEMVFLMLNSKFILTDSGGIQEEAPSLGKPLIVIREKTERLQGIKEGASILVGSNKNKIIEAVSKLINDKITYRNMSKINNLYGDGTASEKIVKHLIENFS